MGPLLVGPVPQSTSGCGFSSLINAAPAGASMKQSKTLADLQGYREPATKYYVSPLLYFANKADILLVLMYHFMEKSTSYEWIEST